MLFHFSLSLCSNCNQINGQKRNSANYQINKDKMKLEMKKLKMYSMIEKVIPTINTKCLGISKLKRITIDKNLLNV